MTLSATSRRAGPYAGNASQTAFPFAFRVFAESDVSVVVADADGVETTLVRDVGFTVSLNANQETSPGGSITYPISGDPLPHGHALSILSSMSYEQPLDIPAGGNFNPGAIEGQFDRTVILIQQLLEMLERALVAPATTDLNLTLPAPIAGYLLGWNQTETGIANYSPPDLAATQFYADWEYDTFTGDGATTQFSLQRSPGSVANCYVSIDGLLLVPGTDFTVSGATLILTSAPGVGTEILAQYGTAVPLGTYAIQSERKIATAGQTVVTLTQVSYEQGANNIAVYVNGVRQSAPTDYAETSATSITFASPLALDDEVVVVVGREVAEAVGAENVGFLQGGTGAVSRTAQSKLRERISLNDFGAVGDGVTDDTAALEAAVAYAVTLNDGVTGEGVPVEVTGVGTFGLSRSVTLSGENLVYNNLAFVALDGEWSDSPLIVLASGQSNMTGNGSATGGTFKTNSNVYVWLATTSSGAGAWVQSPNFSTTQYYVPASTSALGNGVNNAALAFAHRLQEASNRPVRLVIEAKGNQNISEWVGSGTSSTRYAAMESRLTEALAAAGLSSRTVDVFLWQQGENNSGDSANTYEGHLDTLFTQLEAEPWWDAAETAVILGELHDDNPAYNNVTTGIHQRWDANKGMTMWAESAGLTDIGDTIHYTGASLFELGYRRYFNALLRTMKSWCDPMLVVASPAIKLQNVTVDANRKCAGIDVSSGSGWITNCEVVRPLDYGIRLKGSIGGEHVNNSLVTGLGNGDALFSNQDNWVARGIWNGRADNILSGSIVRWCPINVWHDYDAATFMVLGCHFYSGGSGVFVPVNPVNMDIRGGGVNCVGCYLDNGRIDIHNHNVQIDSPILLNGTADADLDQFIGVFATGNAQPFRIFISNIVTVSAALTDGTVPVLQYLPYASQTWTPDYDNFNASYPADVETVGTHTIVSWASNDPVVRYVSGNAAANGTVVEFEDADTTTAPRVRSSGDDLVLTGAEVQIQNTNGWLVRLEDDGRFNPKSTDDMTLGSSTNQWATGYINDIVQAAVATGGAGSGGAGNQYVALRINGVTYKLLHDGTL